MHGTLALSPAEAAGRKIGLPAISLGQHSRAGSKGANQDFHGSLIPTGPALASKGIAVAIADGISSSPVGSRASEVAIKSFLTDYYATPAAWSVKTSADRVIKAANSWLHSQNGRQISDEERDRGHVCTFSALILKSRSAHVAHVGDGRVVRISGGRVEPLTEEHRAYISSQEVYLARALGADRQVEVDYRMVSVECGDVFVLMTDGVHDHVGPAEIVAIIAEHADLDQAAEELARRAVELGSSDDVTVQIVRVEELPNGSAEEVIDGGLERRPAPLLTVGQRFEGFEILRTIYSGSRSHVYLARDLVSDRRCTIKVPSTELRGDPEHLRRMALEEWVAARISNPHVLAAAAVDRPREHLFVATEYIEGVSLDQWMRDNPRPDIESVRKIVEQVGRGLHAFHRREMLHRDLRPANVIIDADGLARIIDFGSVFIAGVAEAGAGHGADEMLGTVQYSAPEYLMGEKGDERSDIFSLGMICYEMLTGKLPFGVRRIESSGAAVSALRYVPVRCFRPDVPDWLDAAIARAVHPVRERRCEVLSEFLHDLRFPNESLLIPGRGPLLVRRPELGSRLLIAFLISAVLFLLWQNRQLSDALEQRRVANSESKKTS